MQKDIGNYIVHSDGKVWSKYWKRLINPSVHKKGYYRCSIDKRQTLVHRLIAEAFIPNPDNLPQVNHRSGNKLDNRIENLEWCDQSHNIRHAFETGLNTTNKLSKDQAIKIKYEHKDLNHGQIAKIYNVSRSSVTLIKQNKSWKHI